jgi:hypothetical protein
MSIMSSTPRLPFRPGAALIVALALSACGAPIPGPRAMGPMVPQALPPSLPGLAGPGAVPLSQAEAACSEMARAQGLGVQSVVGSREVTGPDGVPQARDVLLRVTRGEQVYDVRCNYSYSADSARIMSL